MPQQNVHFLPSQHRKLPQVLERALTTVTVIYNVPDVVTATGYVYGAREQIHRVVAVAKGSMNWKYNFRSGYKDQPLR